MSQLGFGHGDPVGVPFDHYAPLTGTAITMQAAALVVNPAGTIAALSVTLPLNPPDGCVAEITTTQQITALTLSANAGDTFVNGVLAAVTEIIPTASGTAGNASATIRYRYSLLGQLPYNASTGTGINARTWTRIS